MTALTVLLLTIASVGLVLVAMLYARLRAVDQPSSLNATAPKTRGYAISSITQLALHPEWSSEKTGCSLPAGNIAARDNASVTDTERDMVSVRINQALARLGTGWMLHIDAVRFPVILQSARELSHFPDRVSRAIDEERRAFFEEPGPAYESEIRTLR